MYIHTIELKVNTKKRLNLGISNPTRNRKVVIRIMLNKIIKKVVSVFDHCNMIERNNGSDANKANWRIILGKQITKWRQKWLEARNPY